MTELHKLKRLIVAGASNEDLAAQVNNVLADGAAGIIPLLLVHPFEHGDDFTDLVWIIIHAVEGFKAAFNQSLARGLLRVWESSPDLTRTLVFRTMNSESARNEFLQAINKLPRTRRLEASAVLGEIRSQVTRPELASRFDVAIASIKK